MEGYRVGKKLGISRYIIRKWILITTTKEASMWAQKSGLRRLDLIVSWWMRSMQVGQDFGREECVLVPSTLFLLEQGIFLGPM